MIFNSQIEKTLVETGFNNMTMESKNELILTLARRENLVYSQITDEYVLNYHKRLKTDMMSEKCDDVIIAGFVSSNGHKYRMNRDDQVNMMGQKDELFFDESIDKVYWRTEDVGYIEHTRDEWIQKVYREAYNHKKTNLFKYNELKTKIDNAKTHEEIVSITW